MVAEAGSVIELAVKSIIVKRIDFAREHDVDLDDAIKETASFLRSEKLIEALFDEVGERVLRDIWREYQQSTRRHALLGGKRHNVGPLQTTASIYEALYPVEGTWKRLGDLMVHDIEWLEFEYRDRASEHLKYADFFDAIKKRIEGGQVVREVFSESELRSLFERV